jgi:two-component system CheB/CheR fusion protein
VRRLTQELELTQSRLRTVREESDAANEELRAANEELQSINEEYRSTSEELETSKEELQSINEELQTVNSELKLKLEAISRAHSDLQNLVAATDIGTLFLDTSLRIKRFTDRVTDLFSITQTDEGRPITDFAHQLQYDDLVKDARAVLADLAPVRREIRSRGSRWYDMRLRPYRTVDDKIDGVVITFVDISERHQVEQALREGESRQRLLLSELTHRVRNILAVIQAIARHTLRGDQTSKELIQRFEGRLSALASAHTLLVESDWKGADLAELANQQLAPYRPQQPDRLRIQGEPILLPADLATPFGLVLHELATNAAKHGALANRSGKIAVTWALSRRNNTRGLRFEWRETGGPAIKQQVPSGFGSTLIESAIPGGQVKRELRGDGLVCTVEVPLPEPATDGSAGRT